MSKLNRLSIIVVISAMSLLNSCCTCCKIDLKGWFYTPRKIYLEIKADKIINDGNPLQLDIITVNEKTRQEDFKMNANDLKDWFVSSKRNSYAHSKTDLRFYDIVGGYSRFETLSINGKVHRIILIADYKQPVQYEILLDKWFSCYKIHITNKTIEIK